MKFSIRVKPKAITVIFQKIKTVKVIGLQEIKKVKKIKRRIYIKKKQTLNPKIHGNFKLSGQLQVLSIEVSI